MPGWLITLNDDVETLRGRALVSLRAILPRPLVEPIRRGLDADLKALPRAPADRRPAERVEVGLRAAAWSRHQRLHEAERRHADASAIGGRLGRRTRNDGGHPLVAVALHGVLLLDEAAVRRAHDRDVFRQAAMRDARRLSFRSHRREADDQG